MNRALHILTSVLILLLLASGGVVLFRNRLAEAAVVHVLKARTGGPIRIHGLSQEWRSPEMAIGELEVGNPPGFPTGHALVFRKTRLRWSPPALTRGRLHLVDLQTHLAAVDRIQSKAGATNLDRLLKAVETALDRGELSIDRLSLSIGEVRCVDAEKSDHEPVVLRGRGGKHIFKHVNSSGDFASVVHTIVTEELPANLPGIMGTTLENAWKDFIKLF